LGVGLVIGEGGLITFIIPYLITTTFLDHGYGAKSPLTFVLFVASRVYLIFFNTTGGTKQFSLSTNKNQ
jgi:hypothetical protein